MTPTPEEIATARANAKLTQMEAAAVVHLGSGMRWSEYERGVTAIDPARWELFLLKTDQHPEHRLAKRRKPQEHQA